MVQNPKASVEGGGGLAGQLAPAASTGGTSATATPLPSACQRHHTITLANGIWECIIDPHRLQR